MKRVFSVIIAAALLLTVLSGCGLKKKLTAFELYAKAADTIRKAGGVEAECVASFDLGFFSLDFDMHMKQNGDDSEIVLSMGGEKVSTTTTVDGMVYVEAEGVKFRYPVPEDDGGSDKAEFSGIPKLAEDLFNDIEVVENDDGSRELTVTVGADTLHSLFSESADALDIVSFDNALLTMYFDADDDITSLHVTADAVMSYSGFSMTVGLTIDYTFIDLGVAPKISAPEDADEYVYSEDADGDVL